MVKEAEANKETDKKKRDSVDARNQADTLSCILLKKILKNMEPKFQRLKKKQ